MPKRSRKTRTKKTKTTKPKRQASDKTWMFGVHVDCSVLFENLPASTPQVAINRAQQVLRQHLGLSGRVKVKVKGLKAPIEFSLEVCDLELTLENYPERDDSDAPANEP